MNQTFYGPWFSEVPDDFPEYSIWQADIAEYGVESSAVTFVVVNSTLVSASGELSWQAVKRLRRVYLPGQFVTAPRRLGVEDLVKWPVWRHIVQTCPGVVWDVTQHHDEVISHRSLHNAAGLALVVPVQKMTIDGAELWVDVPWCALEGM